MMSFELLPGSQNGEARIVERPIVAASFQWRSRKVIDATQSLCNDIGSASTRFVTSAIILPNIRGRIFQGTGLNVSRECMIKNKLRARSSESAAAFVRILELHFPITKQYVALVKPN